MSSEFAHRHRFQTRNSCCHNRDARLSKSVLWRRDLYSRVGRKRQRCVNGHSEPHHATLSVPVADIEMYNVFVRDKILHSELFGVRRKSQLLLS